MLTELRVRDLAVIADVALPLNPGLNVLTGETGAGKSMLVDALALLLGERASADMVRPGARRTVVEAVFEVPSSPDLAAAADELGIDLEDGRLVVRREINAEGRNRAWANGSPTTVSALATLGRMLVDLHGQHEAQSLLKPASQRDILDAYADAGSDRERVAVAFREAAELRDEEAGLAAHRDDVRRRADYLRHVAKEIADARPRPGEDEALAVEARRLGNVEELGRLAEQMLEALETAEEHSALELLGQADRALGAPERIDASVGRWRDLLETAHANVEELVLAVRDYASDLDADPARLAEVERRRDLLYRLMQKHGPTLEDVARAGEEATRELEVLDTAEFDLDRIRERLGAADAALGRATADLSAKRKAAAKKLAKGVEKLLPGLGMPDGRFTVGIGAGPAVTPAGADTVTFMVQLNPGLDARALAQVASGGELSRLMLALKVVLAAHDAVPTLVFDEVDQGIGGEVAVKVAEALAAVAGARQVLVITHLPQIAAQASHHVAIAKRPRGGIATADVTVLDESARIGEVARMLGRGEDPVVRRHAEELVKGGRRGGRPQKFGVSGGGS
ncbi:MAG: DNA repair protein RecN [Gemmatimonadales bacterium]|nr:DNA repair protein RecN [Gemmatimonadales bacterium]